MKKRIKTITAIALIMTVLTGTTVAFADTEGGTDIANTTFTKEQKAEPFVAYIYVEDDAENNYNNPNRDVGIEFGGDGEYYERAYNYQFKDSDSFTKYKVIRMTGELPTKSDYLYYPTLLASDTVEKDGTFYYIAKLNDKDYTKEALGEGINPSDLKKDYNEFFFVGGNYDWVTAEGKTKLDEIYNLYHSNTGNLSESAAESAIYDKELFTYWQQQMNEDPTITAWQDENGNIYDRAAMNRLGYPVMEGEGEGEGEGAADATGGVTNESTTQGEELGEENTGTTEETEVPEIPTEKTASSKGVPPIVFVILGGLGIVGAVIISYIKREKNESDLYID